MTSLAEAFFPSWVMDRAGQMVYPRGVRYFREGRVVPATVEDLRVNATVRGTVPYSVELWIVDGQPAWSCTCPYAEDGSLCKHVVAATFLFNPVQPDLPEPAVGSGAGFEPAEGSALLLAKYVDDLSHEQLVDIVLESADDNERLRRRLLAEAGAARGGDPDLDVWRRRLERAFAPYEDGVPYDEAEGWALGIHDLIDALVDLGDAGYRAEVVVLAEHAHRLADGAIEYVDDSDGWLSVISGRLADLHHRACVDGDPDRIALAGRLVDLELTGQLNGFRRAAVTYAGVLGADGLAEYRRVLEPRWRSVRAAVSEHTSSELSAVRDAMVGLALADGDPDELIEIHRNQLNSPYPYLEIARALVEAGRPEEAEEWAREGLERFADRPWQTASLREFLASLLAEWGDRAAVIELFWDAFGQQPDLPSYRRLLEAAGTDVDVVKGRVLDALRQRIGATVDGPEWEREPAWVLAEILAHEGNVNAAWAVCLQHGCDPRLRLTLARAREDEHPLDAIGVYEEAALSLIDEKTNRSYGDAVDLLARIRWLADAAGEPRLFANLLDTIRSEHWRKRNLIALLDKKRW